MTEDEREPARLLAAAPAVDAETIRRRFRAVPLRWCAVRRWLPAVDLAIILATVWFVVRSSGPTELSVPGGLLYGLTWCVALPATGAWTGPHPTHSVRAVARAAAVVGLLSWAAEALVDPAATPRQLLALTIALALGVLVPRLLAVGAAGGRSPIRVAVAGDGDVVRRMLPELRTAASPQWDVSAVCLNDEDARAMDPADHAGLAIWVGTDNVVPAALAARSRAVLIAPGLSLDPAEARRLAWAAHEAGLEVYVSTGLLDVVPHRARLVPAGSASLVKVEDAGLPSSAHAAKELVDRVGAALLLAALLPLLGVIALAVRLDSRGPSLFVQQRVGRDGQPFRMYKFRTMGVDAPTRQATLVDANECDGVLFKLRRDPRVTTVGAVLRRYSLDELPQLLNVLRGQMSLVGPRPALPDEVARYEDDPRHRLAVKPGLTGLWQVSGRSDLSWEESVRLDLHYVDNWSLGLDARILLRTLSAVLGHRGAY